MDNFSNFENLCLFERWKQYKACRGFERARFFHKQNILDINVCFKKHVEVNLFNIMHVK